MNIEQLIKSLADAQLLAKDLANDPTHSQSQFVASIRSAIDHAAELLEKHGEWLEGHTSEPVKMANDE